MTTQNHSEWPLERIAEVLAYEAKAADGPWTVEEASCGPYFSSSPEDPERGFYIPEFETLGNHECGAARLNDATFVARARTDLPSAVREIQRLKKQLQDLRSRLDNPNDELFNA